MLKDGRNDVELAGPEFLDGQKCLVFPCQQHVADALFDEGDRRAARARIEDRHVACRAS
jgi:hypothetical protein